MLTLIILSQYLAKHMYDVWYEFSNCFNDLNLDKTVAALLQVILVTAADCRGNAVVRSSFKVLKFVIRKMSSVWYYCSECQS
jgi:hypothetical protein